MCLNSRIYKLKDLTMLTNPAQGQAVIKMYTQLGSLAFAVVLGAKRAVELAPVEVAKGFVTRTMLTLVAGAMLLRFVADQNQDYGLGDGIALIICGGMASGALTGCRVSAAGVRPFWQLQARLHGMQALQLLGYSASSSKVYTLLL